MAFPHNHKTVLVLDRSPPFLKSSDQTIDFDVINKARTPGIIPMAPLAKSLWTCNVEACIEFCRIVFDVYPNQKLIRLVVGDTTASMLNHWNQNQQNIQQLMAALAQCPVRRDVQDSGDVHLMNGLTEAIQLMAALAQCPVRRDVQDSGDVHLMNGLTEAIQALSEISPQQVAHLQENPDAELLNNGRIIALTHLRSESHLRAIEEFVDKMIHETNKMAEERDNLLPIDHCEIVFLHIVPVQQTPKLSQIPRKVVSSVLASELLCSQSGNFISNKMLELCTNHYRMCSTTVTGIPMKEEQNASSSANYDVELLHPADAHDELFISGCAEGLVIPSKEGLYTSTVTLKWCTPKTNVVEMQQCTGAFRFTPVDINSRPSSCLTNFVLNGRSVMLEQPRKMGTRVVSHMLTSHGGELFIHVLATSRCTLEDPPSISEGCGGRVTDYNIKEFAELMKGHRLAPGSPDSSEDPLISKAATELERVTRMWPLTISETILFNLFSHSDPLPKLIIQPRLSDEDVMECKRAIYDVVNMESRNDPLPAQQTGKGKGPKRDDQYRQLWNEMERLVRAHAESSERHKSVLECLLECKKPDDNPPPELKSQSSSEKEEKPNTKLLDQSLKEYDRYQSMTEREKLEFNKVDIKSPDSPPAKRIKTESIFSKGKGPTNLLSLWTGNKTAYLKSRCNEFTGRIEFGTKAQLYKKFHEENSSNENQSGPKTEKVKSK